MKTLVYHLYPQSDVNGTPGTWRECVATMLGYWDLFDRHIIGVALDHRSASKSDVMDALRHRECELEFHANHVTIRERRTFRRGLWEVMDTPGVTMFAHSKGASRHEKAVRLWAEAMWSVNCGQPELVEDALGRHKMAGCFRRFDAMGVPWHYSGTFFWFWNRDVSMRSLELQPVFDGVERWPATHCAPDEAACLFGDHAGNLYDEIHWRSRMTPEFDAWRKSRS